MDLKTKPKYDKKVSFEGGGLEMSDYILPEQDKKIAYNLFIGYLYQLD